MSGIKGHWNLCLKFQQNSHNYFHNGWEPNSQQPFRFKYKGCIQLYFTFIKKFIQNYTIGQCWNNIQDRRLFSFRLCFIILWSRVHHRGGYFCWWPNNAELFIMLSFRPKFYSVMALGSTEPTKHAKKIGVFSCREKQKQWCTNYDGVHTRWQG